jgi:hypothetical protein
MFEKSFNADLSTIKSLFFGGNLHVDHAKPPQKYFSPGAPECMLNVTSPRESSGLGITDSIVNFVSFQTGLNVLLLQVCQ